jgi:hypothetical protein
LLLQREYNKKIIIIRRRRRKQLPPKRKRGKELQKSESENFIQP